MKTEVFMTDIQSMRRLLLGALFFAGLGEALFGQSNPVPDGFVRIQGGTFMMGSPESEAGRFNDEGPQHRVTVGSFYMGKYEVTQKEWREVMGTTVRQQRDKADPTYLMKEKGGNYPMYYVSWYEVVKYCNRRSIREGLTPAYTVSGANVRWNRNANGYRLPTEAEWEYACRAGTTTPYSSGSSVDDVGWYDGNSGSTLHPVGTKQANGWGLYDARQCKRVVLGLARQRL
jgi:formylglycine-generating enzyme required for sulfatase activity